MIAVLENAFAVPEAGLALLTVALVAALLAARRRRQAARLAAVVGARAPVLAAERDPARAARRDHLTTLGLAFGVLAWMQPRLGADRHASTPPSAELCICLDVSRSMLAGDLQPTRLAFAQQAIAELGERARGDHVALVLFAGEARLRVPRTGDVDSLVEIARGVDPSDVPLGGSDLGAALAAGVRALAATDDETRRLDGAILLVTDGEDDDGAGRAAAERARARGLRVHCVGMGSALGSKITLRGPDGRESFLRDRAGNEVVARLDSRSLRALASAGGGLYVEALATPHPLVALYEHGVLPDLQRREDDGDAATGERANRFQFPLAIALALLLGELVSAVRRRRSPEWSR